MSERLARNALANVLQALAGAGLLFTLYRYINTELGVDQLGVWSVILATVSASRLADLGLSAGVIRFVARDRTRGEFGRAGQVVDTAALTLMVLVAAMASLLYPLLMNVLPHLFDAGHLRQAQEIMPYAMVSLWLTIVAAVFQGGLDGCQRMDLRAGLVVAGQALLLVLAFWLVPKLGLVGLAWAQIGQGLFLVVAGRLLMRHTLPNLSLLPLCWNKNVLREMLGYGVNVQVSTIFMLLFDPVAKALMARFGGPTAAGYFEMASQIVLKARAVIVAANQAIVPHVAALQEEDRSRITGLYRMNMRILVFVTFPSFTLLFAWAGGFSWLLIGAYEYEFVFLLGILAVSWAGNIFAGPAYLTNMGTGNVGWNTISHFLKGILNAVLGWLLGSQYGAHGVALAYAIALVTGSWVQIAVFQKNKLGWFIGLGREHFMLIIACIFVVIYGWLQPLRPGTGDHYLLAVGLILPLFVLGLAAWFHPLRQQLLTWLMTREE